MAPISTGRGGRKDILGDVGNNGGQHVPRDIPPHVQDSCHRLIDTLYHYLSDIGGRMWTGQGSVALPNNEGSLGQLLRGPVDPGEDGFHNVYWHDTIIW